MDRYPDKHQIQFHINNKAKLISLRTLYPTYPEISGFEILQFISHLAFQCKFSIEVCDRSDISKVYSALYDKSYYKYHFKGVDLSQKFLFKNIVVKKKTFLDCFKEKMKYSIEILSKLFYETLQVCKNASLSIEFCPITFNTHRFFYKRSFQDCIDWSPFGRFPQKTYPCFQLFEITSQDMNRIMKNKKKQPNNKIKDAKIIKTHDEIKTQIFDTSFLMELFSDIFELCFFELEKIKSDPNPEDIFKLYLRPCVIPNINLLLKYHTDI